RLRLSIRHHQRARPDRGAHGRRSRPLRLGPRGLRLAPLLDGHRNPRARSLVAPAPARKRRAGGRGLRSRRRSAARLARRARAAARAHGRRRMNRIFITGGTGYLGSYVIAELFARSDRPRLSLLTRARDRADFVEKLWRAMQLHWSADEFAEALPRIDFVRGDLAAPKLGIDPRDRERVVRESESVLHIAASLNRKSEKACL